MRNHSRCLSFLLSGILSVSLLAPLSSAQAAYDGSIRNLVDRVTVLTESVQTESANEEELAKLDEMQAELEDKADAKEDVSETETVSMVVTGGTINVRTGPGTNYDKITQVVSGSRSPSSVSRTAGIRSRSTRRPAGCSVNICAILPTSTARWARRSSPWRCPSSARATAPAARPPTALTARASRCISTRSSATPCRTRRPPSIRTAATPSPNPTCSPVIWCSSRIPHTPSATSASTSATVRSSTRDSLSASYYASRYVGAKRIA